MISSMLVFFAYIIDIAVGDPPKIPHPVVIIGKIIVFLETHLYYSGRIAGIAGGALLTAIVISGVFLITKGIILLSNNIHPLLSYVIQLWLLSTTFASKSLAMAAKAVYEPLKNGKIEDAKVMVANIVGRDTCDMENQEIIRATVETVAENTIDGIVAPIFYAFIGGVPLAMAYKAINTLDSMIGYKNEKYLYFGRVSARLDDLANYLPARLGGLMMLISVFIFGKDIAGAIKTMLRDSNKHPSPNSGIPEAIVAGALGIRLGGVNSYDGIKSFRSYLGENINPLISEHINQTVSIMYLTSFLTLLTGIIFYAIIRL
ncbi:MAG: cobalamin biosynthesis protein CobD [Peptococcaceae bacterium]|nr:cobalamin biosynthesis protein CobD [Peptococcaceae bacterium]